MTSNLSEKLHPTRFSEMSPLMAAIVGYVLGESFTNPTIAELTGRGAVLPVSLLEQAIEGATKAKLERWLANPPAPFYVMHIAGSWFGQRNEGQ